MLVSTLFETPRQEHMPRNRARMILFVKAAETKTRRMDAIGPKSCNCSIVSPYVFPSVSEDRFLAIHVTTASIKKAPGGITIMIQECHQKSRAGRECPRNVPNPKGSLMQAIAMRTKAYPNPQARPSRRDGHGLF
jgi:hypothetical protein